MNRRRRVRELHPPVCPSVVETVGFLAGWNVPPLPRVFSAWEREWVREILEAVLSKARAGVRSPGQRSSCKSTRLRQSLFGPLTFILSPRKCGERGSGTGLPNESGANPEIRQPLVRRGNLPDGVPPFQAVSISSATSKLHEQTTGLLLPASFRGSRMRLRGPTRDSSSLIDARNIRSPTQLRSV
jgi:hypothetical protein